MRHPLKSKPLPNVLGGPLDGDYQKPPWLTCEFTYNVAKGHVHVYRWSYDRWVYQPYKPPVSPDALERLHRRRRDV